MMIDQLSTLYSKHIWKQENKERRVKGMTRPNLFLMRKNTVIFLLNEMLRDFSDFLTFDPIWSFSLIFDEVQSTWCTFNRLLLKFRGIDEKFLVFKKIKTVEYIYFYVNLKQKIKVNERKMIFLLENLHFYFNLFKGMIFTQSNKLSYL